MRLQLAIGVLGLAAAPEALAQATFATSSEYSSGSYGETTDTTLVYAAMSAGYAAEEWSFEATLPWVSLEGPATFLGPDAPLGGGAVTRGPNDKVSGFADIALSLTRTFPLSDDGATRLDFTGRLQLPTGEEDKGLSGGNMRSSLGLDLSRDVGEWTFFAGAGYRFNGGGDFEDGAFGSAGLAWIGENAVSIGAAWDYGEASTQGVEAASELSAWVSLPATDTARFQLYAVAGFSEGSPDQAFGARIVFGG